jgi:hypothetical protein
VRAHDALRKIRYAARVQGNVIRDGSAPPYRRGRSRRDRRPVSVGDLISRFLSARLGHPERAKEALALKVFAAFAQIGPPLTDHAEPALLRGGILTLTVADSTWLTELTFLTGEILERVNRGLAKPAVKDLRMRLGAVTKRRVEPAPQPKLTAEEVEKIESWGRLIPNDEVREAMMRAAGYCLKRPPATRAVLSGPPGPLPPAAAPSTGAREEKPFEPRDRWPKDRDRWKDRGGARRGKR